MRMYAKCKSAFTKKVTFFTTRYALSVRNASKKRCIIYHSTSTNPYNNLAFEDWMYNKVSFSKTDCLFIWNNEPCVVIGRHQNPWKEVNIAHALSDNIKICRRNSGGGAVYHDLGNINFTFFSERSTYNRKNNLQVIVQALKRTWPCLNVEINQRDDLMLNKQYKVSGSSAKLGRTNAYHHCTLLLGVDKEKLIGYLQTNHSNIICNATKSVRSRVQNLSDANKAVTADKISSAVAIEYAAEHELVESFPVDTADDTLLPGITQYYDKLRSWQWIYGKTPKFKVSQKFFLPDSGDCTLSLVIESGCVMQCHVVLNDGQSVPCCHSLDDVLAGVKFTSYDFKKTIAKKQLHHDLNLSDLLGEFLLKLFV